MTSYNTKLKIQREIHDLLGEKLKLAEEITVMKKHRDELKNSIFEDLKKELSGLKNYDKDNNPSYV